MAGRSWKVTGCKQLRARRSGMCLAGTEAAVTEHAWLGPSLINHSSQQVPIARNSALHQPLTSARGCLFTIRLPATAYCCCPAGRAAAAPPPPPLPPPAAAAAAGAALFAAAAAAALGLCMTSYRASWGMEGESVHSTGSPP